MSEQKRMASSQIFGLSVAMGLSLVCSTLFLGWLNLHVGWNGNMLKWIVLPALGFGIALSLNSFVQQTLCGRINASQIALGSTVVLGAILLSLVFTLFHYPWVFRRSGSSSSTPSVWRNGCGSLLSVLGWNVRRGIRSRICPELCV
jgi:hypothetical protein